MGFNTPYFYFEFWNNWFLSELTGLEVFFVCLFVFLWRTNKQSDRQYGV